MARELIIIGNGYDLQIGYKTSFDSFFVNKVFNNVSPNLNSLVNLVSTGEVKNILYIFFYYCFYDKSNLRIKLGIDEKDKNWKNVEYLIKILLRDYYFKLEDIFKNGYRRLNDYSFLGLINELISLKLRSNPLERDFNVFLRNQVNEFEDDLKKYINEELEKTTDEQYLIKDELNKKLKISQNTYIINFNYTNVLGNNNESNVHGSLESEVIVGIDLTDIDDIEKYNYMIPYTKTYRKMMSIDSKRSIMVGDVNLITVYGHSLGQQDYSYFQAIFDFYNIYDNKQIKLNFVYSDNYGEPEYLKNKYVKSVFELLDRYGKTMNNKDNGKNLIHKMLLEGRLSIELINVSKSLFSHS